MYDIITIGTATRDVFIKSALFTNVHDPKHLKKLGFLDGDATCFMPGAKLEIEKPVFATGGGATNTATTFARMGLHVGIIGKIGIDDGGDRILAECRTEGIKSLIISDKALSTAYSVILVPVAGERTILAHRGASDKLKPADITRVATKSKWVYIVPGNIPFPTIMHAVNIFTKNGSMVAFNPSKHVVEKGLLALAPLLKKIDVLLMNREEASILTGIQYDSIERILSTLHTSYAGIAVVTDGPAGAYVITPNHRYDCTVFPKKVVADATGAGDAYGSAFVSTLIHAQKVKKETTFSEETIREAIRAASANSASVVEHIGAKHGILTKSQLEKNPRWKKLKIKITTL
ncbi:MAG: ribokinase family sugar kinase [uncultured bacterium]|uniref:Carbohydrate kinase n=2 Tax=Candidatus Wolfeibacteriota TaxID=1752735 RepID=A0A0G1H9N2_9BACT|nr:MAG: ribokinase family sugar kinase [uncultured bacterium]KKR12335.1 MAG: Carbohydrate kinase [Candidatus Wolfebacteria bacterium GW2011_GWC2_39_22]KKT43243.1 MAG: Carbohydrate kinase [Candidatus Wolfebacteria bacterium GW2011_GWE2_44_13]HBI25964.1 hypothetical protein [Candidatus Wolfebacteria bacterium]